jgi:uncharacterized protein (DUF983 family)
MKTWEQKYDDNYADENFIGYECCPECGEVFDAFEFEMQICHSCEWGIDDSII